jgi:DNA-binding transcriptional ArsR family regulator
MPKPKKSAVVLRGESVAEGKREATPEEFKAMAHPLRLRILRACLHDALTNKEIADALGKDPATTLHHVRLLVRTGFLEAKDVRTGARGALEKPYQATGRSWVLSVNSYGPDDQLRSELASIDAMREEIVAGGIENMLTGARLGLRLSDERADELSRRLHELVAEYAAAPDDGDGRSYGLFTVLHRLP